jgi:prefoldin subunit 5
MNDALRLTQERVTYLEDQVEQLHQVVVELSARLEQLHEQVRTLGTQDSEKVGPADDPPPHY